MKNPFSLSSFDVCIVVVTYHPEEEFSKIYSIMSKQAGVVLVDNGSNSSVVEVLKTSYQSQSNVFLCNQSNVGLATALNQGVKAALDLGYTAVALFDQDTFPDDGFVENLCNIYNNIPQNNTVAVLTASYRELMPRQKKCKSPADDWIPARATTTSGSLIPAHVFEKIGYFRDDYFIDWVDTEFCLRAKSMNYHIYKTTKPLMLHRIGEPSLHYFLFKKIKVTNHSSLRRYFKYRNQIVSLRKYHHILYKNQYYCGYKVFKSVVRNIVFIWLYERNKIQKTKAILLGLYDGFFMNMNNNLNRFSA